MGEAIADHCAKIFFHSAAESNVSVFCAAKNNLNTDNNNMFGMLCCVGI